MGPVEKAVWFVESHTRGPIGLDDVAKACHVSPYHMTRAFAATTGLSLMRYVRGRRLTEAARRLADGAKDIFAVAMDAGYGSHEAFTRAFRDHFGLTPEQLRAQGNVEGISLTEAIAMTTTETVALDPPRFETAPARHYVGIVQRYNCEAPTGIPDQWQRFGPNMWRLAPVDKAAYGICNNFNGEGDFDYMCAVQVAADAKVPEGMTLLKVPETRFAVFRHKGHVAGIKGTMAAIFSRAIPESGLKLVEGPTIERYGPEFNAMTGLGGFEVWVPIEGTP